MISRMLFLTLTLALTGCEFLARRGDCANGKLDGRETAVDCGGECGGCISGALCLVDQDCASAVCTVNRCVEPSCVDGVRNGKESEVDCGGDCGPCDPPCVDGGCDPSCSNGLRDGLETDLDCGGPCAPCSDGQQCLRNVDCVMGSCADGRCGNACPAPLVSCGGGCVDPRFDRAHCGGCGMACLANDVCLSGQCLSACAGGTRSCGGACVDPGSNPLHCGGCGQPCAALEICVGGQCGPACPSGQVPCGADCVSLEFDALHCGGCNQPCAAGTACVEGQCTAGCEAPLTSCTVGPRCVDARNDPDHCGACGAACPPRLNAARACVNNSCALGACRTGFEDCNALPIDGCEASLGADGLNCGSCGRACLASDTCAFGRCCGQIPAGSYQATCSGCEACDGFLSCICNNAAQMPIPSSLPLGCAGIVTNCNGVLQCDGC